MNTAAHPIPLDQLERIMRMLGQSFTARRFYPDGHPSIPLADEAFVAEANRFASLGATLEFALVDGDLIVGRQPLPQVRQDLAGLIARLSRHHVESVRFTEHVTSAEVSAFWKLLSSAEPLPRGLDAAARLQERGIQHIEIHLLRRDESGDAVTADPRASSVPAVRPGAQHDAIVEAALAALSPVPRDGMPDAAAVARAAGLMADAATNGTFVLRDWNAESGHLRVVHHAVETAQVCAAMGAVLGLDSVSLHRVAAAGLLHDVGRLLLPPELAQADDAEDAGPAAAAAWISHTQLGARRLWSSPGLDPVFGEIALHHHAPREVAVERVAALAALVSVASAYAAARVKVPYADSPHERFAAELVHGFREVHGATWVNLLLRAVGVYPPGTRVTLSNGLTGMVARNHPAHPLRPVVLLETDGAVPVRGPGLDTSETSRDTGFYRCTVARATS